MVEPSAIEIEADLTSNISISNLKLPAPRPLLENERMSHVNALVKRIWEDAGDLRASNDVTIIQTGHAAVEMWMLLLVRMITRVAYPDYMEEDNARGDSDQKDQLMNDFYAREDQKRQTLCDYIMADFPGR